MRIDELVSDFGGEVPRAEGGRGEVNLPLNAKTLIRPTKVGGFELKPNGSEVWSFQASLS